MKSLARRAGAAEMTVCLEFWIHVISLRSSSSIAHEVEIFNFTHVVSTYV
jgi:hypothetical protein